MTARGRGNAAETLRRARPSARWQDIHFHTWVLILLALSAVVAAWLWLRLQPQPVAESVALVPDPSSVRTTLQGDVVGFAGLQGTHGWQGIPYAEAPSGMLRWHAPRPSSPWKGMHKALAFGAPCPQYGGPLTGSPEGTVLGSEDCLTLNIYAPRFLPRAIPIDDKRLPVMVWLHGGGNSAGSSASYGIAAQLAGPRRLIVVTVNYRLGLFGWFRNAALHDASESPEERSGNYGTLDQVAALRWVHENIAAFGGDPARVTVFGQSAGATDVLMLLASPLARGLFSRAISESASPRLVPLAEGERPASDATAVGGPSSTEVTAQLLLADHRARDLDAARELALHMAPAALRSYLYNKSAAELLQTVQPGPFGMYESPRLFADGAVLPADNLLAALRDPTRHAAVPVILGSTRDEYKLFAAADPEMVQMWLGRFPRIIDPVRYEALTHYMSRLWKAVGTDEPASQLAASPGAHVFVYRFDWDREPILPVNLHALLGAAHGLEIPMVFGVPAMAPFHEVSPQNLAGRRWLSNAMGEYWAAFAANGDPGHGTDHRWPLWPEWSANGEGASSLVLNSERGGGIRAEQGVVTVEGVRGDLASDPVLAKDSRLRCWVYARVFAYSRFHDRFSAADYASLGCTMPIESLRRTR